MKVLLLMFSFTVAALAAVPCVSDHCREEVCAGESDTADDCSGCSPFVSCGSCTGFTFFSYEFDLKAMILPDQRVVGGSLPGIVTHYVSSIWQPPKNLRLATS